MVRRDAGRGGSANPWAGSPTLAGSEEVEEGAGRGGGKKKGNKGKKQVLNLWA